jgi:hypothetical protein
MGRKGETDTSRPKHGEVSADNTRCFSPFNRLKGKGKAIAVEFWTGPEGSSRLRVPGFPDSHLKVVRLSALRTGRLYPQEIFLVFISVRG